MAQRPHTRHWGRALAVALAGLGLVGGAELGASVAAPPAPRPVPEYFWSLKGGNVRQDGATPQIAPRNFSYTRSWSAGNPYHRHAGLMVGTPLIDDKMNVYVHDSAGFITKKTHSGATVWVYDCQTISNLQPAIWNGTLVGSADHALFALDMETGKQLWRSQVFSFLPADGSSIFVHDGVGITGWGDHPSAIAKIGAFSVFTGERLWSFQAQGPLYNLMPTVLEEKQIVAFSCQYGSVYGLNFKDGSEVWRNTKMFSPHTFSTANGMLGINGIFYAAHNLKSGWDFQEATGCLHAVNATDGTTFWFKTWPTGAHATPGVGRLGPGKGLSVVIGLGDNTGIVPAAMLPRWVPQIAWWNRLSLALGDWSRFLWGTRRWTGQTVEVRALDAETGKEQWRFETPTWWRPTCAGDEERFDSVMRGIRSRAREICTCDSWSSPTIGGDGTVYIGNAYGVLYALKDENGDGVLSGEAEVSSVDLGASILMPPSIAPGMLVAVSCDEVAVYRT